MQAGWSIYFHPQCTIFGEKKSQNLFDEFSETITEKLENHKFLTLFLQTPVETPFFNVLWNVRTWMARSLTERNMLKGQSFYCNGFSGIRLLPQTNINCLDNDAFCLLRDQTNCKPLFYWFSSAVFFLNFVKKYFFIKYCFHWNHYMSWLRPKRRFPEIPTPPWNTRNESFCFQM